MITALIFSVTIHFNGKPIGHHPCPDSSWPFVTEYFYGKTPKVLDMSCDVIFKGDFNAKRK